MFLKKMFFFLLLCLLIVVNSHAEEPDRDPFYTKGISLEEGPPTHGIFEEVDPFSGNLKIVQTDIELPQNGGLELKIMRYYDSAIWGKVDELTSVVVDKFGSTLGVGWYMHMGMLLNPSAQNPTMIMPDGSQHIFYNIIPADNFTKVSKEFARLETPQEVTSPARYVVTMPDGIIYTFEALGSTLIDLPYTQIAQLVKIENPAQNASIDIEYIPVSDSNYQPIQKIDRIIDSVNRTIQFNYQDPSSDNFLTSITVDNRTYNYNYLNLSDLYGELYSKVVFEGDLKK